MVAGIQGGWERLVEEVGLGNETAGQREGFTSSEKRVQPTVTLARDARLDSACATRPSFQKAINPIEFSLLFRKMVVRFRVSLESVSCKFLDSYTNQNTVLTE